MNLILAFLSLLIYINSTFGFFPRFSSWRRAEGGSLKLQRPPLMPGDVKNLLLTGVSNKNLLKEELIHMAEDAIDCFDVKNWELSSRDSMFLRGFFKVFAMLDWLTVNLTRDDQAMFQGCFKEMSPYGKKFSDAFDQLQEFTLPCTVLGQRVNVHPATIWGGLKHQGLAAITTRVDPIDGVIYEIGEVSFPAEKISEFAHLAKDVALQAPL